MRLFLYGDLQQNTKDKYIMALYIEIKKKKKFFLLRWKLKCRRLLVRKKNVVITKLSLHKPNMHKQDNDNDSKVEEIEHYSSGKLFTDSQIQI